MLPDSKNIKHSYSTRNAKFIELYNYEDWKIKIYSIAIEGKSVSKKLIANAKDEIPQWLANSGNHELPVHKYSTLILHEARGITFAVINWWIDENVLQQFVYRVHFDELFELYSDKGIIACVWELAIIWFERNAWVKHVLSNPENPQTEKYLSEVFNGEV